MSALKLTVITSPSSNNNSLLLRQIQDLRKAQLQPDIHTVLTQKMCSCALPTIPTNNLSTDFLYGFVTLNIEGFASLKSTDSKIKLFKVVQNKFLQKEMDMIRRHCF